MEFERQQWWGPFGSPYGGLMRRTNRKGSSASGGHLVFTRCEAGPRKTLRSKVGLCPVLRIIVSSCNKWGNKRKHDLILW